MWRRCNCFGHCYFLKTLYLSVFLRCAFVHTEHLKSFCSFSYLYFSVSVSSSVLASHISFHVFIGLKQNQGNGRRCFLNAPKWDLKEQDVSFHVLVIPRYDVSLPTETAQKNISSILQWVCMILIRNSMNQCFSNLRSNFPLQTYVLTAICVIRNM